MILRKVLHVGIVRHQERDHEDVPLLMMRLLD
jgi:hypothetical protein